jgi:phosphoribosylanthranilate isomerase
MKVRVKICGITTAEDALAAVDAGADALGFIFFESSPRWVSIESAAAIIRRLPPLVAKVGVFVNASEPAVRETVSRTGIDTLQFHGDEPPPFCAGFAPVKVYKAFRVRDLESLAEMPPYKTDAWLLDSYVPDKSGGTGARFNWDLAVEAQKLGRPIILAGGLTPGNVAEAVRRVRPYAVDVSSGVESSPGRKSPDRIRAFIEAVHSAQ